MLRMEGRVRQSLRHGLNSFFRLSGGDPYAVRQRKTSVFELFNGALAYSRQQSNLLIFADSASVCSAAELVYRPMVACLRVHVCVCHEHVVSALGDCSRSLPDLFLGDNISISFFLPLLYCPWCRLALHGKVFRSTYATYAVQRLIVAGLRPLFHLMF